MMAPHFSEGTGFHCVESITPRATIRTHHRPTRTVVANGKTRKYRTISELDKGRAELMRLQLKLLTQLVDADASVLAI
jgi:hypothetical protein